MPLHPRANPLPPLLRVGCGEREEKVCLIEKGTATAQVDPGSELRLRVGRGRRQPRHAVRAQAALGDGRAPLTGSWKCSLTMLFWRIIQVMQPTKAENLFLVTPKGPTKCQRNALKNYASR
ncbi:uncharacterized protein LOC120682149 isoform X5 [Panicum virgatum]|uniref:uncharacterized protein LOC120682149 isoform X5 n=1 Tax=Panicum virgatum TaxID=38727 RepID=UPI0019D5E2ED|nr:uncharacterized protein LOC120682149 isoform X5 [Panicum virgatum]